MDQNSNMGGFAPMPDNNGFGSNNSASMPGGAQAAPAAAPGFGAAPMTNTMPNPNTSAPLPGMPAPGMPAAPGMPGATNPATATTAGAGTKKDTTLIETIILVAVCVIAAAAIVFAVIFFMQYNELKTNFDSDKNAAVAAAVEAQQEADNEKFKEDEKLPYAKFTGPSDYGSISFEYPKTWSLYVENDGSNNSDYSAYFKPVQVDPINDRSSRYALRFKILNQQITTVQSQYDSKLQDGSVTSSVFNADNNNVTGTKYVGAIEPDINGIIVLIKVNDKTVIFQTDAMTYQADFDTLISKIRRNS